jgi:2-polyprenyl-3-methyl-5-hydroxy-6-metoxy-1,4-benzoquinol methylase
MIRATTDSLLSLAADEFVWQSGGLTEAHHWILPVVSCWLDDIEPRRVLDLGCGNGSLAASVSRVGREVVGLDRSESGIAIARRSYPEVQFIQASTDQALPQELRKFFDVVISIEVIEHLTCPRELFSRAREALAPGGQIIVSTPFHGYWKNLALALTGRFDEHWHPLRDCGHIKFFSVRTLSALFLEQGFTVLDCVRVGRLPFLARSMVLRGQKL